MGGVGGRIGGWSELVKSSAPAHARARDPSRRFPQASVRAASKRFTDLARFVSHGRHFRATVAIARRPTRPDFVANWQHFLWGGCRLHDDRRDQILSTIVDNSARCWTLTPLLDGRYGVLIQAKRSTLFDTFLSPIGDISALWWLSTNRTTTAKREGCGPTENDPDPPPTDATVAVYPSPARANFQLQLRGYGDMVSVANQLSSPWCFANPTHRRQGAGLWSVATHVSSAKSCDTVSLDHGAAEKVGMTSDCSSSWNRLERTRMLGGLGARQRASLPDFVSVLEHRCQPRYFSIALPLAAASR